jgi:ABC-2 type transport system ATP-binding protein
MQHAERLCDRIILIAKGKKIFDGPIAEAKRLVPRRVRIETGDPIDILRALPEVLSARSFEKENGSPAANGAAPWELELHEQADPQVILQTCFERGIRLRSFNQTEPTLHEVFMRLVGASAHSGSATRDL